jgi:serine phosphatase RsbU (regulator of sigma subunit)
LLPVGQILFPAMKKIMNLLCLYLAILIAANAAFAQQSAREFERQLRHAKRNKDDIRAFSVRIQAGDYYFSNGAFSDAIENYKEAVSLARVIHNPDSEARASMKLGSLFLFQSDYGQAQSWYKEALRIATGGRLEPLADSLSVTVKNIGNILQRQRSAELQLDKLQSMDRIDALDFLEKQEKKQRSDNARFLERIQTLNAKNQLIELELKFKQQEVEYNSLQINLLSKHNELKTAEISKKEAEIELSKAETAKQKAIADKQQLIIGFSSAGLVLISLLAFVIFRGYLSKRRANNELIAKNKLIEQKNKEITDSILYAKKLQEAILTSSELCNQIIPNNFILFKPKDIVSGDFYWAYAAREDISIWTVADCTGHGVPGAFMNMIGSSLLNEIVIERSITDANLILDGLKSRIIKTFGKSGATGETRDGMDAALCVWHKKENRLEYAGAYNPLYLIRNSKLIILEADRRPIGYHMEDSLPFTKQVIQLEKGDTIYLFSDGYVDQFGGVAGKKFSRKRFKELLLSIHHRPMPEQKQILDSTIEDWKGQAEQIDDICVIGVYID